MHGSSAFRLRPRPTSTATRSQQGGSCEHSGAKVAVGLRQACQAGKCSSKEFAVSYLPCMRANRDGSAPQPATTKAYVSCVILVCANPSVCIGTHPSLGDSSGFDLPCHHGYANAFVCGWLHWHGDLECTGGAVCLGRAFGISPTVACDME